MIAVPRITVVDFIGEVQAEFTHVRVKGRDHILIEALSWQLVVPSFCSQNGDDGNHCNT